MNIHFKNLRLLDKQTCYARAGPDPPPPIHWWWIEGSTHGPP